MKIECILFLFPSDYNSVFRVFTDLKTSPCNWKRQKAGRRLTSFPLPLTVFFHKSDGVQQTTYLAQRYCHEATREISKLRPSPEREALIQLTEMVLVRDKWENFFHSFWQLLTRLCLNVLQKLFASNTGYQKLFF